MIHSPIYFLCSSFNGELLAGDSVLGECLRSDLAGTRSLTAIASSPNDFSQNDKFFLGCEEQDGIKDVFVKLAPSIDKFKLLDERFSQAEASNLLAESDVVCLLGGNPFVQLDFLSRYRLLEPLSRFIGIVIGVSGGSINMAKTSYCSKDETFAVSQFYKGVGLVDLTIDPHFSVDNKEQVAEALKFSMQRAIFGVPDNSALRIEGIGGLSFIGSVYEISSGLLRRV